MKRLDVQLEDNVFIRAVVQQCNFLPQNGR